MKKYFFFLAAFLMSSSMMSAQSTSLFSTEKANAPISFGARAGISFTKEKAYGIETEGMLGVNFGVDVDVPFWESLYFKSGLYANIFGNEDYDLTGVTTLTVPVLASYRYQFTPAAQLQINAGPYATFGILGKFDEENMYVEEGYKRFHVGFEIGAGVTYKRYYVGLAYDKGLSSVADEMNNKWNVFKILVGYNF